MTTHAAQSISELLDAVQDSLAVDDAGARELLQGVCGLLQIAQTAEAGNLPGIATGATTLARLLEIAECVPEESGILDDSQRESLIGTVAGALSPLQQAAAGDTDALSELESICNTAQADWGDYLELLPGASETPAEENAWAGEWSLDDDEESIGDEDDPVSPVSGDPGQVDLILAALTGDTHSSSANPRGHSSDDHAETAPSTETFPEASQVTLDTDPELRDAFLDDATRGLAAIEQIVLNLEQSPGDVTSMQHLCRELHTLKGASASVGLSDLAALLHGIEDLVQSCQSEQSALPIPRLLNDVDSIRNHIAAVGGAVDVAPAVTSVPAPPVSAVESTSAPTPQRSVAPQRTSPGDDGNQDSLRVSTARLDRLMDLLGELVILRNRRQSEVDQLKALQDDLLGCVSRLRQTADHSRRKREADTDLLHTGRPDSSLLSVLEIADDVTQVSRTLQQNLQPLSDENAAISRVIRRFRHELTELRRVPIHGLFQRLQRAARDVARQEGKQLQVRFLGDQTGLERSLQERLFEPLVHLVRNAVSHGVEDQQTRSGDGKSEAGTITLEAVGSLNSLTILIRDDGRGIDREAVRRRGIELGLWDAGRSADDDELLGLIFRPGFSTRQETTEVSGRGVGMDVVANALENLRGKIDLETDRGRGTTIRLTIALRSVIEHLMVFRVGGQQFGIPMQYVDAASRQELPPELDPLHQSGTAAAALLMGQLLGLPSDNEQTDSGVLVMSTRAAQSVAVGDRPDLDDHRAHTTAEQSPGPGRSRRGVIRQAFHVDEVAGPEEVVVRPLPPALTSHPLLAGATLSGSGQVVLLLDCEAVLARAEQWRMRNTPPSGAGTAPDNPASPHAPAANSPAPTSPDRRGTTPVSATDMKALVVDDSPTARLHAQRLLEKHGVTVVVAENGADALEQAREAHFDLVLSDFEMPRLDGLQLLDELRTCSTSADWPVAIVSSRNEDRFQTRARQSGATAWYTKPLRESQLIELLAAIGHPDRLQANPASPEVEDPQ